MKEKWGKLRANGSNVVTGILISFPDGTYSRPSLRYSDPFLLSLMRNAAASHFTRDADGHIDVCGRQERSWMSVVWISSALFATYVLHCKFDFNTRGAIKCVIKDSVTASTFSNASSRLLRYITFYKCNFLIYFSFFFFFFIIILALCDRVRSGKEEIKKQERKSKIEKIFIRPWSHTRAGHVRVGRPRGKKDQGKRERERADGGMLSMRDTPEMRKFHIPEERKEACVGRSLMKTASLRSLFRSRVHGMAARRREEPTRQRYQANARERDRTHRWKSIFRATRIFRVFRLRKRVSACAYNAKTRVSDVNYLFFVARGRWGRIRGICRAFLSACRISLDGPLLPM